jgi:hypothetical protein
MRFDPETHDGIILLASDRRKGVWASQTIYRGSRTFRQGGQLPVEASAHTCELVALCTALRSITKAQATKLVQTAPTGVTKPRILIVTADPTFAEALTAKMQNYAAAKPLRAGKNFLMFAAHQLSRFTVTLIREPEDNDRSILVLESWARQHVIDPKLITRIPPSLVPTAIGCVL